MNVKMKLGPAINNKYKTTTKGLVIEHNSFVPPLHVHFPS